MRVRERGRVREREIEKGGGGRLELTVKSEITRKVLRILPLEFVGSFPILGESSLSSAWQCSSISNHTKILR